MSDESLNKMGRLTDNEVREVAEMQRHIDNLEEYLSVLFATLRGKDYPTRLPLKEDTDQSWFFNDVWEFLKYVRTDSPGVLEDFKSKERQERQRQIQRWQERKTKRRKPFWKRLFACVPHRQSSRRGGL